MAIQRTNATVYMKIIITDTNVFFDIISIGALPEFLALDLEIYTTDFVIKEILESEQQKQIETFIRAKSIQVIKFTPEELVEIKNFKTHRFFKGITDKSVLWKSYQLKCILLTGDKKIRNEAQDLNLEVHGSIWVINEMVDNQIVTKSEGAKLLERLKLINSSLPHDEIDKLINELK
jgi:predicted nucleic acid-binding protein